VLQPWHSPATALTRHACLSCLSPAGPTQTARVCLKMVRPLRASLQALARGQSAWMTLPGRGGEWRQICSSDARWGTRLQQQAKVNGDAHAVNGYGVGRLGKAANDTGGVENALRDVRNASDGPHRLQTGDLSPQQHARDVILGGAAALQQLAASVDESFDRTVEILEGRTPGSRVIVVGIGKSGHLARKMAATLSSTGTASFFMHGTEALHGDLGGAQPGDVAILLSNSGETEEILQAAAGFRNAKVCTVALTALRNNALAAACDHCLSVGVHKELDHNGLAPTASAMATMALGDALAVVLSQRINFSRRDFSLCHPAGQLGKIASDPKP